MSTSSTYGFDWSNIRAGRGAARRRGQLDLRGAAADGDGFDDARRLPRQHNDAFGEGQCLVNIMGAGTTSCRFPATLVQLLSQPHPSLRVERGKWLIHQDDVGLKRERTGNRNPLAFPAGASTAFFRPRQGRARELTRGPLPPLHHGKLRVSHLEPERRVLERMQLHGDIAASWKTCRAAPRSRGVAAFDSEPAPSPHQVARFDVARLIFCTNKQPQQAKKISQANVETQLLMRMITPPSCSRTFWRCDGGQRRASFVRR